MFIVKNFIIALIKIIDSVLTFFYWLIILRVLLNLVNANPYNFIVQFVYRLTEPILFYLRKFFPFTLRFGIDISPLLAFLLIIFIKNFLIGSLWDLVYYLSR